MAMDAIESPTSPSQSAFHFSQPRHFYLAVDRLQFKMGTLEELLGVVGRRNCLPMVVCCSSRDELDAICSRVSNLPFICLTCLYSDQAEAERALILEKFRQATLRWNQEVNAQPGDGNEMEDEQKSCMIVVTDACLPLLSSGESPIAARVLINYELPIKKETYLRRMATCLATDGIVINMVVGGEVVTLKSLEESSNIIIADMPINTTRYPNPDGRGTVYSVHKAKAVYWVFCTREKIEKYSQTGSKTLL